MLKYTRADYFDPIRYKFDCHLGLGKGKFVVVGSYTAEFSEQERQEASCWIWSHVPGE